MERWKIICHDSREEGPGHYCSWRYDVMAFSGLKERDIFASTIKNEAAVFDSPKGSLGNGINIELGED